MSDCAVCRRPIHDTAYVCSFDADRLARQLREAADLVPELDTALARLARFSEPGPRPRNSAPAESIRLGLLADPTTDHGQGPAAGLPYAEAASIDRGTVTGTVGTWVRVVREERRLPWERPPSDPALGPLCVLARRVWPSPGCGHVSCQAVRDQPPPRGLAAAMRWLADEVEWLRHQPFAPEAFEDLGHAAGLVWRAVDRPTARVDVGPCLAPDGDGQPCQRRLTARPAAVVVVCPDCRAVHSVQARRDALLRSARNIRGTATECAHWLTILGIDTTASMVRGLAHRGRIIPDGFDRYALGDVERCRLEQIEREQRTGKRQARAAA